MLTDGQPRNCTVRNPNGHACRFIAIDNCLEFKDEEGNTLRTCDCALVYADEVLVVELKHKRKNQWVALGVDQLKATIELWKAAHPGVTYRKRRAVLANSKHPRFNFSHKSTMQRFYHDTGFRLLIIGEVDL